jgi:hypothetical protein
MTKEAIRFTPPPYFLAIKQNDFSLMRTRRCFNVKRYFNLFVECSDVFLRVYTKINDKFL